MPKLKFAIDNQTFEIEGSQEEILEIIQRMTKRPTDRPATYEKTSSTYKSTLMQRMPDVDQLLTFILSRPPKYEHDILTIASYFLKEKITSRQNPREYRKLSLLLQNARKIIEHQKQGRFEALPTCEKNLKKYVFKPLTKSLEESMGIIKSGQLQGDGAKPLSTGLNNAF